MALEGMVQPAYWDVEGIRQGANHGASGQLKQLPISPFFLSPCRQADAAKTDFGAALLAAPMVESLALHHQTANDIGSLLEDTHALTQIYEFSIDEMA
jgi:hypothetical protein